MQSKDIRLGIVRRHIEGPACSAGFLEIDLCIKPFLVGKAGQHLMTCAYQKHGFYVDDTLLTQAAPREGMCVSILPCFMGDSDPALARYAEPNPAWDLGAVDIAAPGSETYPAGTGLSQSHDESDRSEAQAVHGLIILSLIQQAGPDIRLSPG